MIANARGVEQIFNYMWQCHFRSVVITSPEPCHSASSIAHALAQRNVLSGHSTLLVDLNVDEPKFSRLMTLHHEQDNDEVFEAPALISSKKNDAPVLGITAPSERVSILKLRKPGVFERYLNQWYEGIDTIVINTPAIHCTTNRSVTVEQLASASDATFMVVDAGITPQTVIKEACAKLRNANVNLAGCILDDTYNPSLKMEMLRICRYWSAHAPKLTMRLTHWIERSSIFSFDE